MILWLSGDTRRKAPDPAAVVSKCANIDLTLVNQPMAGGNWVFLSSEYKTIP
jgi:hypothetical protein